MARKIMYAISNVEGDSKKKIYCENLEKNEYEAKYKGYLTCIKGCQARIKFTQRKNDIKFFSTWNKEGNLHEKSCPYHVDYKGKWEEKVKCLLSKYRAKWRNNITTIKKKNGGIT